MASYRKRGSGWVAEVCINGIRRQKRHPSKAQARAWAAGMENRIAGGDVTDIAESVLETELKFSDVLRRYQREVAPTHKGARWESIRVEKLLRDKIADVSLRDLDSTHFADWRDRRLEEVKSSSVNRELNLMSSALSYAITEWRWTKYNPIRDIRRPRNPPPRERRVQPDEAKKITRCLLEKGETSAEVATIFELALETAMRLGEICGIREEHIHEHHLHLPDTKNGTSRDVPLTPKAKTLARPFKVNPQVASKLFSNAVRECGIKDLVFHDSRHEATTRLALGGKLSVLELASITGHKDPRMLMRYFNPTAADLAAKLA